MQHEASSFEAFRSPTKPGPQFTAYHNHRVPRNENGGHQTYTTSNFRPLPTVESTRTQTPGRQRPPRPPSPSTRLRDPSPQQSLGQAGLPPLPNTSAPSPRLHTTPRDEHAWEQTSRQRQAAGLATEAQMVAGLTTEPRPVEASAAGPRELTPRRVGPRLSSGDASSAGMVDPGPVLEGQESTYAPLKTVKLDRCEVVYLSSQVVMIGFGTDKDADQARKACATTSSASVWATSMRGGGASKKEMEGQSAMLMEVGKEAAQYLKKQHARCHSVIVSHEQLASLPWGAHVEVVDWNPYEPLALDQALALLVRLNKFLQERTSNVVVLVRPNVSLACALVAMTENVAVGAVQNTASALARETALLAGSMRYLAMLGECVRRPQILSQPVAMAVGSVRLFGDHEFVRSTEHLIRVHIELHHSGYIDSSDFREQTLYRVTRSDDNEACLVLHFLPVELRNDVRVIVFSTLAGDMGLITGPQPMFQLIFHTSFVDPGRPLIFNFEDLDKFHEFCPVHRVEFIPGPRNDEQLAAPEVKFVRKKLKKKSASPLSVITDLLTQNGTEDENQETPLAATRPIEKRSPGKVYRDDSFNAHEGTDYAYSLPDDYPPSLPESGRQTPTRYATPPRRGSGAPTPRGSGRQSPAGIGGRQSPAGMGGRLSPAGGGRQSPAGGGRLSPAAGGRISPAAGGRLSPAGGGRLSPGGGRLSPGGRISPGGSFHKGPPSPRIPVPKDAALDSELPAGDAQALAMSLYGGSGGAATPNSFYGAPSGESHRASPDVQMGMPAELRNMQGASFVPPMLTDQNRWAGRAPITTFSARERGMSSSSHAPRGGWEGAGEEGGVVWTAGGSRGPWQELPTPVSLNATTPRQTPQGQAAKELPGGQEGTATKMGAQAEAFRAALGVWEGSPKGPLDQKSEKPPAAGSDKGGRADKGKGSASKSEAGKGAGGLRAELDSRLQTSGVSGRGDGDDSRQDSRQRYADAELGFATPRKEEVRDGATSPQLSFSVLENGTPPASLYGTQAQDGSSGPRRTSDQGRGAAGANGGTPLAVAGAALLRPLTAVESPPDKDARKGDKENRRPGENGGVSPEPMISSQRPTTGWNGGMGGIVVDVEESAKHVQDKDGSEQPAASANGNGNASSGSAHTAVAMGGSKEGKQVEQAQKSRMGLYIGVGLCVVVLVVVAVVLGVTRCFDSC